MSLVKQPEEIQKLDEQIAELFDEEAIEKEIFDRCDFEAAVQEVICGINFFVMSKVSRNQMYNREVKSTAYTVKPAWRE